jgi:hypothetical protein
MAKNKTIYTIHADTNKAKFVWVKDDTPSRSPLGRTVTDEVFLYELCQKLPSKQASKLTGWTSSYLMTCLGAMDKDAKVKNSEIDWKQFNKEGMAIAKGLKKVLVRFRPWAPFPLIFNELSYG